MLTGNEKVYPLVEMVESGVAFASDGARGITIRQYYAGLAMQGLAASGFFTDSKLQKQCEDVLSCNISVALAVSAVDIANELINELNKTELQ